MTTVRGIRSARSVRAVVAGEIRAELSRAQIRPAQLPRMIGRSQSYWSRRVNGVEPFDVDDLEALAGVLGCAVVDFFARTDQVVRREGIEPPTRWLRPALPGRHLAAA